MAVDIAVAVASVMPQLIHYKLRIHGENWRVGHSWQQVTGNRHQTIESFIADRKLYGSPKYE